MNKLKKFFSRKCNRWGVGTLLFLLVGGACFLLGAYLCHWNIWGWFTTKQAFLVYGLVAVFLLTVVALWWYSYINTEN